MNWNASSRFLKHLFLRNSLFFNINFRNKSQIFKIWCLKFELEISVIDYCKAVFVPVCCPTQPVYSKPICLQVNEARMGRLFWRGANLRWGAYFSIYGTLNDGLFVSAFRRRDACSWDEEFMCPKSDNFCLIVRVLLKTINCPSQFRSNIHFLLFTHRTRYIFR